MQLVLSLAPWRALVDTAASFPVLACYVYSRVEYGYYVQGFGGTASGPAVLQRLHADIDDTLQPLAGSPITVTAIVDIMNMIGRYASTRFALSRHSSCDSFARAAFALLRARARPFIGHMARPWLCSFNPHSNVAGMCLCKWLCVQVHCGWGCPPDCRDCIWKPRQLRVHRLEGLL